MILAKLALLYKGTLFLKVKTSFLLAVTISPATWLLDTLTSWHLQNQTYVAIVVGAIAADHLIGSIYHAWWAKDFTIKDNVKGLIIKLTMVVTVGYLFEGLNVLMRDADMLKDYTIMMLRLMVFLYPAGSAFSNSYIITGGKFPPLGFMEWFKKLNKK